MGAAESVMDLLRERLNSKIYSALFISWPVINYKMLLVFFSPGDYEAKLKFVEYKLYENSYFNLNGHLYLLPLCAILVVNTIVPLFEVIFTWLAGVFDSWKNRALLYGAGIQPFPKAEQAAHFKKFQDDLNGKDELYNTINKLNLDMRNQTDSQIEKMRQLWRHAIAREFSKDIAGGKVLEQYLLRGSWDVPSDENEVMASKILSHPLCKNLFLVRAALQEKISEDKRESRDLEIEFFRKASDLEDEEHVLQLVSIICLLGFAELVLTETKTVFRVSNSAFFSFTPLTRWASQSLVGVEQGEAD